MLIPNNSDRRRTAVQLGWEGSILEAVQGVLFCILLSLTGWMVLVHKTHRVALFNALAADPRRFLFAPSSAVFLLYTGTALGMAFSRCACTSFSPVVSRHPKLLRH